ncbi:MAG: 50S ribosomal protein L9 [Spirochaetaceae bacterium]|nr:50S ribosomal protein L9 [Spirochaetaceae bacterium]
MKVILKQDFSNLGEEGDIKIVADGYGRNFLIPKGIAAAYTKANIEIFKQKKNAIEARKETKRKEALSLKEKLSGETITFTMPVGEKGKLFGAITSANIVEELSKTGISVEKKKIDVPENSIKVVGNYIVRVKLYAGETADLNVVVKGIETETKTKTKTEAKAKAKVEVEEETVPETVVEPETETEPEAETE